MCYVCQGLHDLDTNENGVIDFDELVVAFKDMMDRTGQEIPGTEAAAEDAEAGEGADAGEAAAAAAEAEAEAEVGAEDAEAAGEAAAAGEAEAEAGEDGDGEAAAEEAEAGAVDGEAAEKDAEAGADEAEAGAKEAEAGTEDAEKEPKRSISQTIQDEFADNSPKRSECSSTNVQEGDVLAVTYLTSAAVAGDSKLQVGGGEEFVFGDCVRIGIEGDDTCEDLFIASVDNQPGVDTIQLQAPTLHPHVIFETVAAIAKSSAEGAEAAAEEAEAAAEEAETAGEDGEAAGGDGEVAAEDVEAAAEGAKNAEDADVAAPDGTKGKRKRKGIKPKANAKSGDLEAGIGHENEADACDPPAALKVVIVGDGAIGKVCTALS